MTEKPIEGRVVAYMPVCDCGTDMKFTGSHQYTWVQGGYYVYLCPSCGTEGHSQTKYPKLKFLYQENDSDGVPTEKSVLIYQEDTFANLFLNKIRL